MSTQFAPREVPVDRDIIKDVERRLSLQGIQHVESLGADGLRYIRVAPAHAPDLADVVEAARVSKEEEARASVSVGGLSVEQAERLVTMIKDAPASVKQQMRDGLSDDLKQALNISDPEHEATIVVRFRRLRRPGTHETQEWVRDALAHYFNEVEPYCGRTAGQDYEDAEEAILDVTVREIVSLSD